MNRHLSKKEIVGYLYATLTDAQREVLDQHLSACGRCRGMLDAEQKLKRQIEDEVKGVARNARPSTQMSFDQIRPNLAQRRKRAHRIHTAKKQISRASSLAIILLIGFVIFQISPSFFVTAGHSSKAPIFNVQWEDATPYRNGLISSEQEVLHTLAEAPIYHIEIEISENLRRLDGRQSVRYINRTDRDLNELYLRLVPNWGDNMLIVDHLSVNGRSISPIQETDIDLRVPLPKPLAVGETAVLDMDFSMRIGNSRVGFGGTLGKIENVLNLAHFHPILATYNQDGWDLSLPVHGIGSLAEDSYYMVRVSLPGTLTVITTGNQIRQELNPSAASTYQTLVYTAGPINQFFLSASDRYDVMVSTTHGETTINSYAYQGYLLNDANKSLRYAVNALKTYESRFGKYPFTELDLIGTPTLTSSRDTAFFPGVNLLAMNRFRNGEPALEQNVVEGVAYQWLGRINRDNMVHEPWLGYALTHYSTLFYYNEQYDPQKAANIAENWQHTPLESEYQVQDQAFSLPASSYASLDFKLAMEQRGPATLDQFANSVGNELFADLLTEYYAMHRWQTGSGRTFKKMAEDRCKCRFPSMYAEPQYK